MRKFSSIMARCGLVVFLAVSSFVVAGCKHAEPAAEGSSGHVHTYTCPMHPEVVQNTPGTCPKCGMRLTHKD